MFFDDAKLASKELELTLTGRDCGQNERAPMCGVPYHSSESYVARLVSKGYKVAICEQMEDANTAKGIVKRDVVRVITPGTVLEGSMLDETRNNFICSLFLGKEIVGICFCDISTGELYVTELTGRELNQKTKDELGRFNPKEILIGGDTANYPELPKFIRERLSSSVEILKDSEFETSRCEQILLKHFKKDTIDQLGLNQKTMAVSSLGALITYLGNTQKKGLERINLIELYSDSQFMHLDIGTRRNLELLQTMRSCEKRGSLLWVLDQTKTAMGKRLMRIWLEQPLLSCVKILRRQNAVAELHADMMLRGSVMEQLSGIYDLERLMTRIVYGSANARDLRSLVGTISRMPEIRRCMKDVKSGLLIEIRDTIDPLCDVKDLIGAAIVEDPPFSIREGGIIKKGFHEEIDLLRGDMTDSQGFLTAIEAREREKTGIPKLKVGYNRVAGYYIEVTNSFVHKVPDNYIRKQTLTNCERYITKELKELEGRILGAKDKSMQLEYQVFNQIRERIAKQLDRIQKTAKSIAQMDVLCSFAEVAAKNRYCCPVINTNGRIMIKDGRHPVVERLLDGAPFVPNDVMLDKDDNRVAIITGPNMAGKSTYMRQTALISLMAQIGCFVPAREAEIGIIDSIFTRVGASDDLASGQSTFMVEMTEVAQIVKNATCNSLLILDEIGRGTSTFDGMSIARAVLEYVADQKTLGAKTLFATHYHELTELEQLLKGVKNYNIAVKKRGDDITFLRRIVPGGADDSYGIEVAKLAGIPEGIVIRAKEILKELESGALREPQRKTRGYSEKEVPNEEQLTLVPSKGDLIIEKIKNIDVNTLTPIEAMNILYEIAKVIGQ